MKAKVVVLIVTVSVFFFLIGAIAGSIGQFLATTTAGVVGANDCCTYVDTVLTAESAGRLDQILIDQFNDDCGLRSGFMISHEYDGNAFVEFRSFCSASSVEVSVVYASLSAEKIESTHLPVCVDIIRVSDESYYAAHSNRRAVFDREQYELYLASLERE